MHCVRQFLRAHPEFLRQTLRKSKETPVRFTWVGAAMSSSAASATTSASSAAPQQKRARREAEKSSNGAEGTKKNNDGRSLEDFRQAVLASSDKNFLLAVKYAGLSELASQRLEGLQRPDKSRWLVDKQLAGLFVPEILQRLGSRSVALLLFAERDEAGKPWCPDCERAEPALRAAFSASETPVDLVEVSIPRALWKGDAGQRNAFRSAPFSASGIPTLLHVADGVVGARLGEEECLDQAAVAKCLSLQGASSSAE